ncbi:MAG: lipopolysaccharide biosynthesis protein [Gammaproteobacteria bacterium]
MVYRVFQDGLIFSVCSLAGSSDFIFMNKIFSKSLSALIIAGFRLGASLGNLALIFIVSNVYGMKHVGVLSLLIASALGISIAARFGYDVLAIKHLPAYMAQHRWGMVRKFIAYFSFRTIAALFVLLAAYWVVTSVADLDFISLIVLTIALSVMALLSAVVKSALQPIFSTFYELGYALIACGLFIFLYDLAGGRFDLVGIQRVVAGGVAIYSCILFVACMWRIPLFQKSAVESKLPNVAQLNVESLNFMLIMLAGYFYAHGYVWLSGELFDLETVGYVSVIARVVFAINFSMMIANIIFNPKFAIACANNDRLALEALAGQSLKMMIAFSVFPFFLIVIFPNAVLALFGVDSPVAAYCLVVMAIAQMINVLTGNASAIMNLNGRERIVRNGALINLFLASVICSLAVPFLGVVGLVGAYALGIVSQNIFLAYYLHAKQGVNIYRGALS